MLRNRFLLLFILVFFLSFIFGIFFENKKFYPYLEIKKIYYNLINLFENIKPSNENNLIKKQNINEFELEDFSYTNQEFIETSVIKLNKEVLDLKNFFPNANDMKSRGGICLDNDHLIIVSASGESVILNNKNEKLLFFDLQKHFNNKKIKINILQDILCLNDQNKNDNLNFLINVQKKEKDIFIEKSYEAEYTSNIYEIEIKNLKEITSKLVFKSKLHGDNWAGRMVAKNNKLYISFSSRDANKENLYDQPLAQDDKYLEGKILEINLNDKKYKLFTKGHRNPQGLTLLSDNSILSTEHGPRGGDELNIIKENKNYGWPIVTHGTSYERFDAYSYNANIPGRHDGFYKPIFSWTPGIGISNLLEIKNFDPKWNNDLLISSLKNMSLYRVRYLDKKILFSERIWIGSRIRDLVSDNKSVIYLWTDDKKIIKLSKVIDNTKMRTNKTYDIERIGVCLSCHYLNSGEKPSSNLEAPTLTKIFEREIASDGDFKYSDSLNNLKGKWDKVKMTKYLIDPQKFAPGTFKSYSIKNSSEALKIVDEIEKLSISGD